MSVRTSNSQTISLNPKIKYCQFELRCQIIGPMPIYKEMGFEIVKIISTNKYVNLALLQNTLNKKHS